MNALARSDPPSAPWQNPAPWYLRAIDTASTYLPLLLMAVLALGTWWLVKNTPLFEGDRAVAPLRHEPDYTMTQFMVQRFGASGAMRVQIEGDLMRHYPDTDTFEIDNPRIRTIGDDGRATTNIATPTQTAIEFRGEFLHYFQFTERVRSHLPVVVTQGGSEIRADAMAYDNLARVLDLKGRVRAVLTPPAGTGP